MKKQFTGRMIDNISIGIRRKCVSLFLVILGELTDFLYNINS